MGIYVDALGTVTPIYTVTVCSQITGRVMEVHYREGQMVRKGEPLMAHSEVSSAIRCQ
jgi:membrane fusion protein, multidrug efflux system